MKKSELKLLIKQTVDQRIEDKKSLKETKDPHKISYLMYDIYSKTRNIRGMYILYGYLSGSRFDQVEKYNYKKQNPYPNNMNKYYQYSWDQSLAISSASQLLSEEFRPKFKEWIEQTS